MLSWSSKSISRDILEHKLNRLPNLGLVLDVGGGSVYGYEKYLKYNKLESVNIDTKAKSTHIADIENKLIFKNNLFDTVLCLNVLEHVFHHVQLITEINRILKKGGLLVVYVPCMHHLHSNPYDFYRYSQDSLKRLLSDAGFSGIKIEAQTYGVLSLLFQTTIHWHLMPIRPFIKHLVVNLDKLLNNLPFYHRVSNTIPLAYFVTARK